MKLEEMTDMNFNLKSFDAETFVEADWINLWENYPDKRYSEIFKDAYNTTVVYSPSRQLESIKNNKTLTQIPVGSKLKLFLLVPDHETPERRAAVDKVFAEQFPQ